MKRFPVTVIATSQLVDVAQHFASMDVVTCKVREGSDMRNQIESGIRFLLGDKCADSVDLECGLRVARA